ncbi:MAG: YegP family protein [Isosphaeraceae bacterium]
MYEMFPGGEKLDKWYWHLKAANHEIVAQGQGYSTKEACLKGIEAVRNEAKGSLLLDLSVVDGQGRPAMIDLDARTK